LNTISRRFAIAAALVFMGFPQVSTAGEFTANQLLQTSETTQNNYFQVSVTMAAVISAQNKPEQARCINEWYFKNIDTQNLYIRELMQEYRNFHPSGVILGILEKTCGEF